MTVKQLAENINCRPLTLPDGEREVSGVYIGDLLSWVMGRAGEGNVWITIMSNINTVAVATLADVCCIILAEGVTLDQEVLKTAEKKRVNVISTDMSAYDTAIALHGII